MNEQQLRALTGPLTRQQVTQLTELALRYGYSQPFRSYQCYVACPLGCGRAISSRLGASALLRPAADGPIRRALQDGVRQHLTTTCPRTTGDAGSERTR